MENDTAQYPVNQWIVVGEPVVSKNQRTRRVKQSDVESNVECFTCGKLYREIYGLSDNGVASSINQLKFNGGYRVEVGVTELNQFIVYETMSQSRVNKCK